MEAKSGSHVSLKVSEVELKKQEYKKTEDELIIIDYPVWSSRLKCIMAYICGITNFPGIIMLCTSAGEFGATTLVPHLLCRIVVGTPIAFIEIMLGRFIMGNISRIRKMCPLNNAVFVCLIVNTILLVTWNNVLIIYVLKYLIGTFSGQEAWAECGKSWAHINCYKRGHNTTARKQCILKYSDDYCRNLTWENSEQHYWRLIISDPFHSPGYNLLYLLVVMCLVVLINCKGIRSLEKVFYLLVFGTLLLLAIFVIGSFHIPGEVKGLINIWFFDSSLLLNPKIWIVSFENCILSIGLGVLCLSFISSHGKFFDDIFLDVLVAVLTEVFYFVIMAVPISGIIWLTKARGESQTKYPLFKDHLDTFISISAALTEYPSPSVFWAGLFYTQAAWLSLGNQAILVMAISDAFYGIFELSTIFTHFFYFVCIIGGGLYILTVPVLFVPFNHLYPFNTVFLTALFLFVFTLNVFYGSRKFRADFHFFLGYPPPLFFRVFWIVSMPILFIFLILKICYQIPDKPLPYVTAIYIGIPFGIYSIGALYEIYLARKKKELWRAFVANPNWGPNNAILKTSRMIFDSVNVTKEFLYRQDLYKKLFIKPLDFTEQNIVHVI